MGFILSTISVFLRDMFYVYGIVLTIWNYLTPVMYDISAIGGHTIQFIMKFNPMYQFIDFARTIILYHNTPSVVQFVGCGVASLIVFLFGIFIFKKKQDKFIYYV